MRSLDFSYNHWVDNLRSPELDCGPLPLRTLRIIVIEDISLDSSETTIPPLLPSFGSAMNLQELRLLSKSSPPLHHITLTSFDLSAAPTEGFRDVSQLLYFLEALPVLQTVHLKIIGDISLDDVPQEVIVLPKAESPAW